MFNAGVANFTHIDWPRCLKQLASSFLGAITAPEFYVQSVGKSAKMASAGSGKATYSATTSWCGSIIPATYLATNNIQFRALQPLLQNSAYPADSRIIWSSSLEASPKFYDQADWQLTKTEHSYESVKYQIDLIATILDRHALQDSLSDKRIRHFVSHPGVCSTKISTNLVAHGSLLDSLKIFIFHLVRQPNRSHPPDADRA